MADCPVGGSRWTCNSGPSVWPHTMTLNSITAECDFSIHDTIIFPHCDTCNIFLDVIKNDFEDSLWIWSCLELNSRYIYKQ